MAIYTGKERRAAGYGKRKWSLDKDGKPMRIDTRKKD